MKSDAAYMESLVQRYEQRLFDLEEIEVELREKLALLEQGRNCTSSMAVVSVSMVLICFKNQCEIQNLCCFSIVALNTEPSL